VRDMTPEDRARLAHDETEPDDIVQIPIWIDVGIFAASAILLLAILIGMAAWVGAIG